MKVHTIGIIMNGVTGRMGTNQHLLRSIVEIIEQGGVSLGPSTFIMPDPVLVGRNPDRLRALADSSGIDNWSTDPDAVLSDDRYGVYFDAQTTDRRPAAVTRAIEAGDHEHLIHLKGDDFRRLIERLPHSVISAGKEFSRWVYE